MPKPIPDSPEDKALWARAEELAHGLLDTHEGAIAAAIDDAFFHKRTLLDGAPVESDYSEALLEEAKADPELGLELAERVWQVLHAWAFHN